MFGFLGEIFGGKKTYTINVKAMDDFVNDVHQRRREWNEQVEASRQSLQEAVRGSEKELAEDESNLNVE